MNKKCYVKFCYIYGYCTYIEHWNLNYKSNKLLLLLLCARKYEQNSVFSDNYLPLDMFKYIMQYAELYGEYINLNEIPIKITRNDTNRNIITEWNLVNKSNSSNSSKYYYVSTNNTSAIALTPLSVLTKIPNNIFEANLLFLEENSDFGDKNNSYPFTFKRTLYITCDSSVKLRWFSEINVINSSRYNFSDELSLINNKNYGVKLLISDKKIKKYKHSKFYPDHWIKRKVE